MKIDKKELQQADRFIQSNLKRIIDWSIGDIKRCCRIDDDGVCGKGGALVGAFMLWCSAIDYYGGLYTGLTSPGSTKSRIEDFISKYMPNYPADKLVDLRWALLHYYTVRHFVLYHHNSIEENKNIHLTDSSGGIMLHLGCSIRDLENAVKKYNKDLEKTDTLKIKAWKYYKELSPLMPVKVSRLVKSNVMSSLATGTTLQNISASGPVSPKDWFE